MQLWNYIKSKLQVNAKQKICENSAEMTFEQAMIYVEEFSKKLKGVKCCAVLCQSEMAASIALLSCFAAEVTALPLSQRYGELHCNKIMDVISPDAVITDQDGDFQIIHITDSLYIEHDAHPALIMCTSGTTGVPKGALLTENNIVSNVKDISRYFEMNSSDTILISRPLYHCAVLTGEFLTALVKGANIRFFSGKFNPSLVMTIIRDYDITVMCGTPTLFSLMSALKKENDIIPLRIICISGECMSVETGKTIRKAFQSADIYSVYGLTEAAPRVSYLPSVLFDDNMDCVGYPLHSVSLRIVTENGKKALPNEIGLLWVKGPNIMLGYYNNIEKTNEVLKNGWLCTGDLALINDSGLLKIKGRNDDLIIKAGMNIYPQEIENALKIDPRVREVFVHGQKDKDDRVQIVLNIVGDFPDRMEVKKLCHTHLPSYQRPTQINLLDEIPKNASGKIIRR